MTNKKSKSHTTVQFANYTTRILAREAGIYTRLEAQARPFFFLHWLFSNHAHRLQILLINNTSGKNPKTEDRILRAQRNIVVHLVLTALGAVAVETQGLVGHQLLAARVDSSANGNTKILS